jgi:hypothetical protein
MIRHLSFAIILFAAAPAFGQELPTRKAGLWEIKIGGAGPAGAGGSTMQQCTDAATDKALTSSSGAAGQQDCSKKDIKKISGGMVIDSVCAVAGRTVTSHIEVNGSFDSAYTMKISSDAGAGGPAGVPVQMTITMDAKWLGPCKADQKPGDMIMPGGMKINVTDMQRARGGAPGAR